MRRPKPAAETLTDKAPDAPNTQNTELDVAAANRRFFEEEEARALAHREGRAMPAPLTPQAPAQPEAPALEVEAPALEGDAPKLEESDDSKLEEGGLGKEGEGE